MRSFLVFCLAVASVVAESPFLGYHERVGIPLAAQIQKAELAAKESSSRIIGGQPAPLGAHPYLVGIVINLASGANSACGSSMVSNTRVITAAHCWFDGFNTPLMFTLVFGSEYLFTGGVRVDTSNVDQHPGWDGFITNLDNDIAIVSFNHVSYTNVIQPISLPTGALESNDFVGVWAQASGYGMIGDGIPLQPNQVQSHVTLQVISVDACRQFFPSAATQYIICTSGVGPVGICSSDSGGPLSIVNNNQRVLIGVSSFGSGRCEGGFPSGFVRVTEHLPWIQERI